MSTQRTVAIGIAAVLIIAAAVTYALAQPAGPPQPGPQGPGMQHGFGMGMGPGMRPGMGGPPMSSQLAVSGDGVFVLAGPKLMKFSTRDLKLVAEAELPKPEPPEERGN